MEHRSNILDDGVAWMTGAGNKVSPVPLPANWRSELPILAVGALDKDYQKPPEFDGDLTCSWAIAVNIGEARARPSRFGHWTYSIDDDGRGSSHGQS